MIYFTSDFHFNHYRLLDFECGYLFEDSKQRTQEIFKIWRENIHKDDTVYFLGDFGYLSPEEGEQFKALPGKKHMLLGNHDKFPPESYKERYGFIEVSKVPIFLTPRVVLSHIPIPTEDGTLNIHGHLHNCELSLNNHINAGIHVCNYKFLSYRVVERFLSKTPKNDYHFMHEWYAKYHLFHTDREDIVYNDDGSINVEMSAAIIDARKERLKAEKEAIRNGK